MASLTGHYRVLAQLELDFNSVERIVEYLDVAQEAPAIIPDKRPPAFWPSSNGELAVRDLEVRYAPELPTILKKISFTIRPAEKIGVVSAEMFLIYFSRGLITYFTRRLGEQAPVNQLWPYHCSG